MSNWFRISRLAAGLLRAFDIAKAHPRVTAMLVASEDMVADLGTSRSQAARNGLRAPALSCRAAAPPESRPSTAPTLSATRGRGQDAKYAKALGYRMKSLVAVEHRRNQQGVFRVGIRPENARQSSRLREIERSGKERAKVNGKLVEVPIYSAAKRLLKEHAGRVGASAAHIPPPRKNDAQHDLGEGQRLRQSPVAPGAHHALGE